MKKFIVLLTVVSLFLTGYACAEGLGSLFGGLTSLFSLEDETAYSVGDTADLESASVIRIQEQYLRSPHRQHNALLQHLLRRYQLHAQS